MQPTPICSRTLLVQRRERLLASFAGSSGPSVLNFIVNFRGTFGFRDFYAWKPVSGRKRNWIL